VIRHDLCLLYCVFIVLLCFTGLSFLSFFFVYVDIMFLWVSLPDINKWMDGIHVRFQLYSKRLYLCFILDLAGRKHREVDDDVRHGAVTCTRTLMTSSTAAVTSSQNVELENGIRTRRHIY